jgi:hypothetical protein
LRRLHLTTEDAVVAIVSLLGLTIGVIVIGGILAAAALWGEMMRLAALMQP